MMLLTRISIGRAQYVRLESTLQTQEVMPQNMLSANYVHSEKRMSMTILMSQGTTARRTASFANLETTMTRLVQLLA